MNVQDSLAWCFTHYANFSEADSDSLARKFLNKHARELAERIRARGEYLRESEDDEVYISREELNCYHDAADLINPEAQGA